MPQHGGASAGGFPADYLSTLSSPELQRIMRDSDTHPLPALINHGGVAVDYDTHRVWRDCYWKGSFARDTIMGWEERLLTPVRGGAAPYVGGRFWKRFDQIRDGEATGFIIDYGQRWLPGYPRVREVVFPDATRPYAREGDTVLLLNYLNRPFRGVYDVIKVVDDENCIGVMHLGTFPRGRMFATFVMARNNYPFHKMTVPDHDLVFDSARAHRPQPADLEGTWTGHLVLFRHPERAMHNQFNPPILRARFRAAADGVEARLRVGLVASRKRVEFGTDGATFASGPRHRERIRRIDERTLLVRRTRIGSAGVTRRYVLTRLAS